ncbi:MAG: chorismate mutase [Candidatus Bathyarchaeia archaeon]
MEQERSLKELREEIRQATVEIIRLTGERLSLAKKIGRLKREMGMPIEDLKAEEELRSLTLEKCQAYGVDRRFGLKLLNLLIDESKRVQRELEES